MSFKKYEIKNYSEYIINVSVGKRTFSIPFTGGALTNQGSIPASYSTNNEIIQYAIEHSRYYAIGIVYLAQEIKTEEEIKKLVQSSQPTPQPASSKKSTGDEKAIKKIKVSDLQEAKNYLVENYNVSSLSLRGEKSIMEQAKIFGVEFIID